LASYSSKLVVAHCTDAAHDLDKLGVNNWEKF